VPEGDTIHKIAAYLGPRLDGRVLGQVRMTDEGAAAWCAGRRVTGVSALGKHLFIELDETHALRSHLGMRGSWHRYAPGECWRKPQRQASVVLEAGDDIYVCFNAKEVELVPLASVRERIVKARLGPDLVNGWLDGVELTARAREFLEPDALIADALLDQRIAAGIGNVYKSEVLFIAGLLPQRPLDSVPDDVLAGCYATAADLLRRNLGGGRRVTRFVRDGAGRTWAYGRSGLPCLRCDGTIESARLGRHQRSTYWCARCQA
jgi:endonuclease-8